jgi:hypothetical protein
MPLTLTVQVHVGHPDGAYAVVDETGTIHRSFPVGDNIVAAIAEANHFIATVQDLSTRSQDFDIEVLA